VRRNGTKNRVLYRSKGLLLGSPEWGPGSRRIAFLEFRYPKGAYDLKADIYVIDRKTKAVTRITKTPKTELYLDWSSRNLIAFTRARTRSAGRGAEIFKMRPDGSHVNQLTHNKVSDRSSGWAPGGWRLTFVRAGEVWTMYRRGGRAAKIAVGSSPAWSPSGKRIAYVGSDGAIHLVTPRGRSTSRSARPCRRDRWPIWIGDHEYDDEQVEVPHVSGWRTRSMWTSTARISAK
jgi:Tol biopolymer transport system component